jgi:hypothetical protein
VIRIFLKIITCQIKCIATTLSLTSQYDSDFSDIQDMKGFVELEEAEIIVSAPDGMSMIPLLRNKLPEICINNGIIY